MRCTICGEETNEENPCASCRTKLNQIQILSPVERENFNGVTIEEGTPNKEYSKPGNYHSHQRVYTFNSSNGSIMTKLILGAILLILIIVALPIAIFLLVILGFNWLLRRSNS